MTIKAAYTLLLAACFSTAALAQADPCGTWETLGKKAKDDAITNHTLYRDLVKAKQFEKAFPLWEAVYKAAPGADGKRSLHYSDGRDIYLAKYEAATDEAEKQQYSDMIMRLYEENHKCYPKESAALYSNQIYNMFYVLKRPYEEQYDVLAEYYYRTGLLYEGRDRGDWLMTARQLLDLADNHSGHASTNRMERKRLLDQLIQSV